MLPTIPKARYCYGLLRADADGMHLRFVPGRTVNQVAEDFLAGLSDRLAAVGESAWLSVWDKASWPISKRVRAWIKAHSRWVGAPGGGRFEAYRMPIKSSWFNPNEPK